MKVVSIDQAQRLKGQLRDWAYNALDITGTREVYDNLIDRLDDDTRLVYGWERAMQAPALAMSSRGIAIDEVRRKEMLRDVAKEMRQKITAINKMPVIKEQWDATEKETGACPTPQRKDGKHKWEKGPDTPERKCLACGASRFRRKAFNPNSPDQCNHLFYDILRVKALRNKKGEVSTDEDTLERLAVQNPKHKALADTIIEIRGLKKQHGTLSFKASPDGRYMSTFNPGQAWTGRWSSNKNAFGEGGNSQNIAERHRRIFVADPGKLLCYADLKQAESNIVAHLAGDEKYIEAHKSGDVHTYVTRLVWPELPWTWDLSEDKKIAKRLPDWDQAPGHDYRFQAKRIQHGGNYGLSPFGISRIAHIPLSAAKDAFYAYHDAFPGIRGWQRYVGGLVKEQASLINPLGRKVKLFGRPWDEHTYKQGLSFLPQSCVADIINLGIWRIWIELDTEGKLELLAQVHDACVFQFPEDDLETAKQAVRLMEIGVPVTDYTGKTRIAKIEAEAAIGRNWGHYNDKPFDQDGKPLVLNPNGIKEIHI